MGHHQKLSKQDKRVQEEFFCSPIMYMGWEGAISIEHRKVLTMLDTCDVGVVWSVTAVIRVYL